MFTEHTRFGFRPKLKEGTGRYLDKVINTINKSIESGIPFLLPQLAENHLRLMQAVIVYLASSTVPRISVNALCKRLNGSEYIIRDDADLPNERTIPMWTLWMEY